LPSSFNKTDAIQLALERENEAVDVFIPYAQLPDSEFTYGQMFASRRTPTFLCNHKQCPNQSMKPTAPNETTSVCLLHCPAVAYLYLVKRRYHAICFPQSAYGRGLHPDLPAIAHPFIYSSRSLEH
jgi:hypothetical protein